VLTIEPVQTRQQQREFRKLPWRLYRDDPHWVPTPGPSERRLLDSARNPFFQHARMACWLARRGREVCGRIAAIIDDNHNHFHQEQAGAFGFFEVAQDYEAAAGLLGAAREWVAHQGMKVLRGPMSPSTNFECGLLVEGFGSSPLVMMSYNPPYYADYCERFGLVKARNLYAYWLDLTSPLPELARRAATRAVRAGVRFRCLDLRREKEEIARLRAVYDQAWERNWGFVPLTDAEWAYLAEELRPLLRPELVVFAEAADRVVGMVLAVPNVNPVLQGLRSWRWPWTYLRLGLGLWKTPVLRLLLVGVVPEYHNLGVGPALYEELYQQARRLGYDAVEISWVLEENTMANRSCQAVGGRRYKTYRIYEMPVA